MAPREKPTAPTAVTRYDCAAGAGVGDGVAVVGGAGLGAAVAVLGGAVGLPCSRDAMFKLGIVMVWSEGVKSGDKETIMSRGAKMGNRVGMDVMASDFAKGLTVMTESAIATGVDVLMVLARIGGSGVTKVLVLVPWIAGTEDGVMMGERVGVLVGCSTDMIPPGLP
jgi:hypothetical protein